MPDDLDARDDPPHSTENSPDLVGEELGDGAKIWRVYDRVAREEDRERIGNWNRGLDNLALFAGLFSAVTTAFIIQLQQDIEPDYAHLTFLVLNASAAGVPFKDEPFAIDPSVRTTNCLWVSSLMLSLTAALIAIMGKDWIGMYVSRPVCNPRQWAEIRTYRVACVERWYMSGVIASAPVLLHISLVLFAAGLVVFVAPDPFSQRVALGLALAAGGLYLIIVISAIVFPTSPFKSPATQALRGAIGSICTYLYDRMVYRPKRHPVEMLQCAALIIGAALAHELPASILPLDRSHRSGEANTFWFSRPRLFHLGQPWKGTVVLVARHSWARWTAFVLSLPALLRSALENYRYRRQRPRTRPWHVAAKTYLRQIDLSDRWAAVRSQRTPNLLAESLSDLNSMTQATDVFRSILVALGDIAIGREVAPLVSFDLKSRLATEVRHNWQKCDLVTLSRYMLADRHVWDIPLIPSWADGRFSDKDTAARSENIAFALVERNFVLGSMLNRHFPDLVIQPRALQYLLPGVSDLEFAIILAQRYWDHMGTDQSMDLKSELWRLLLLSNAPWDNVEVRLQRRFGGSPGLLELLVASLDYVGEDIVTTACALLVNLLPSTYCRSEQPCLVYAFGHEDPSIADAAWTALSADPTQVDYRNFYLELSLPLARFAPRRNMAIIMSAVTYDQRASEMCLARTIVMLLLPSRQLRNSSRSTRQDSEAISSVSTLELCVRGLCMQLCHDQSALNSEEKVEIITLIIEKSVFIRICSFWDVRSRSYPMPTTERNVINILTAIARRLTVFLASDKTYDRDTGARLFCLFSFSEAADPNGQPVAWDLGSYLRTVAVRLSEQDPSTDVSMRRLVLVLRALRPLCASRDDLRAAWERINVAPDDSFWNAVDFQLGPLLDPDVPAASLEGASLLEDTRPPVVSEEGNALYWLDAAMR